MTAEEVLVYTRLAARQGRRDEDGPPRGHRAATRVTGKVYVALTNNTDRGNGAASARCGRGQPAQRPTSTATSWSSPSGGDHAGARLRLGPAPGLRRPGRPATTYFAGFPTGRGQPDLLPGQRGLRPDGNLWISTDGNRSAPRRPVRRAIAGAERGEVKQFLTVPIGAETCGPWSRTSAVFVAVQHPGEIDGRPWRSRPAAGPTAARRPPGGRGRLAQGGQEDRRPDPGTGSRPPVRIREREPFRITASARVLLREGGRKPFRGRTRGMGADGAVRLLRASYATVMAGCSAFSALRLLRQGYGVRSAFSALHLPLRHGYGGALDGGRLRVHQLRGSQGEQAERHADRDEGCRDDQCGLVGLEEAVQRLARAGGLPGAENRAES